MSIYLIIGNPFSGKTKFLKNEVLPLIEEMETNCFIYDPKKEYDCKNAKIFYKGDEKAFAERILTLSSNEKAEIILDNSQFLEEYVVKAGLEKAEMSSNVNCWIVTQGLHNKGYEKIADNLISFALACRDDAEKIAALMKRKPEELADLEDDHLIAQYEGQPSVHLKSDWV